MTESMKGVRPADEAPSARALLVGLDVGNAGLAGLWLAEAGWEIRDDERPGDLHHLVVLESRHPRREHLEPRVRALQGARGVPVLLISPAILPGTPPTGALARELGVAALLSVPLDRTAFVDLCACLVRRSPCHDGRC